MIAACPHCKHQLKVDESRIVDRNLLRCPDCYCVFVASRELIDRFVPDARPPDPPDEVSGEEESSWKPAPDLLDGEQARRGIGEATIISRYQEDETFVLGNAPFRGELAAIKGPCKGLTFRFAKDIVVLGREEGDIVLKDEEVSRRHAAIRVGEKRGELSFTIEDLGSLNGTFLNGRKIERTDLSNLDEIEIGASRLIFFARPPEVAGENSLVLPPIVKPLSPSRVEKPAAPPPKTGGAPPPSEEDATIAGGEENVFLKPLRIPFRTKLFLEVIEGPDQGEKVEFTKGNMVIGRRGADVELRDTEISRRHALVEALSGEQIYVKDLASLNGTFLNGEPVKHARLKDGDVIQVGGTKLLFRKIGPGR